MGGLTDWGWKCSVQRNQEMRADASVQFSFGDGREEAFQYLSCVYYPNSYLLSKC